MYSMMTIVSNIVLYICKVQSKLLLKVLITWLPWWLSGKEFSCQRRRRGFDP